MAELEVGPRFPGSCLQLLTFLTLFFFFCNISVIEFYLGLLHYIHAALLSQSKRKLELTHFDTSFLNVFVTVYICYLQMKRNYSFC